jgi:hypothetical protein
VRATDADATVFLVHDGELADVAALLAEIGLDTRECRGKPTLEDRQKPWELVIGTPPRLRDLDPGGTGTRIAVVDEDSKTLRAMLCRVGVDYTVRRPVHPTALRLLLVHAVYQGPERRRTQRVQIGAPTRFRAGFRRHDAVLADLSITGCRLLARISLSRSRRIRIQLPEDPERRRTFTVSGRVIRSGPAPDEPAGIQMIAIHFEKPSRRALRKLSTAVDVYGKGPATLDASHAAATARVDSGPAEAPEPTTRTATSSALSTATPRSKGTAHGGGRDPNHVTAKELDTGDRRAGPRRSTDRHVIALSNQATKVLMGRDISLGGMRVAAAAGLSVGDTLQLALHVRAREAPLVVRAEVTRDDGANGLALAFRDLDESSRHYLENMVKFLPILASRDGDGGEGVIVSEILEHSDG